MNMIRRLGFLALRSFPLKQHQNMATTPLKYFRIKKSFELGTTRWFSSTSCQASDTSWHAPDGYDTGVKIYNSATKTKVPLLTKHPNLLTWYTCGPTVYDSAHIGHALCYVKLDIIRRILLSMFDLNVVMVMGITDIDDKIINRANEMDIDVYELTDLYEKEFFSDMAQLRVIPPSIPARVSEHMPQIINFVQEILQSKLAYVANDGSVYFDTKKYGRYGKFITPGEDSAGMDASERGKISARDFALWKAAKPGEPFWKAPWGPGRPGWHIECSAMASHVFGTTLDLHSGGIDLKFPHHENEEAQCCAHHDKDQWCNYWLHTGHLHMGGTEKMSKSLRNTISVGELLQDHSVNTFRLFCLLSHYRNKVEYTETSMQTANAYLRRIRSVLHNSYAYINGQLKCAPIDEPLVLQALADARIRVSQSLADDFDTVRAMDAIMDLIAVLNKQFATQAKVVVSGRSSGTMVAVSTFIQNIMKIFGVNLLSLSEALPQSIEKSGRLSKVMNSVVDFRQEVRAFALLQDEASMQKDLSSSEKKVARKERVALLQSCDRLRDDLLKEGLHIKDHAGSSSWNITEEPTAGEGAIADKGKVR